MNEANDAKMEIDLDHEKIQSEFDQLLLFSTIPQIILAVAMIFLYHKNPIPANQAEVQRVANKYDGNPLQILTQTLKYYWILIKNRNYWSMLLSWGFPQGMNIAFYITFPTLVSQGSKKNSIVPYREIINYVFKIILSYR